MYIAHYVAMKKLNKLDYVKKSLILKREIGLNLKKVGKQVNDFK